ncbi:T9SS type A sorting domain-containing protein [Winogradskyella sp. PE311]|uniref:T9SS type A sorting domain-containing protein n=1 Tax=Winogradskyella sp. PE311 TaxID=3366943 RepID=UPI00398170DE
MKYPNKNMSFENRNCINYKFVKIRYYATIFMSLFLLNSAPRYFDNSSSNEVFSHFGYLKLIANSTDNTSSTIFYFNSNATRGLDPGYDASMFGGVAPPFALYSHLIEEDNGTPYAIQSLNGEDMGNATIPLGINASQGENIVISILQTDFPTSINIYLEDNLTDTSTLLNNNDFTFTTDSDISGIGRFYLKLESSVLDTTQSLFNDLKVSTNQFEKSIIIKGKLKNKTSFKIYDINGKSVNEGLLNISSNYQTIKTHNIQTGVYLVELKDDYQKLTKKLIIN